MPIKKEIEVRDAKPGMTLGQSVYTRNGNLLLDAGVVLSDHTLDLLDLWGIFQIQVQHSNKDELSRLYGEVAEPPLYDIALRKKSKQRVEQIGTWVHAEIKNMMTAINAPRETDNLDKGDNGKKGTGSKIDADRLKKFTSAIVEESMSNKEMMLSLTTILDFDTYLFAHAVHVSILNSVIGIAMGLSHKEVHALCVSGSLLDIGMTRIDRAIWDKEGPLTDAEFTEIKKHPLYSVQDAEPFCKDNSDALRIVVEHHERLDGSGYPRKLKDRQIHPLSRIAAVCDIYDAMQAPRRYRKKRLPYQVMGHLLVSSTETLDCDVVKVFLRTLSSYPIGSFVRMDSGSIGVVVSANRASPIRPVVKVFMDSTGKKMDTPRFVDLNSQKGFIVGPVDPKDLGIVPFEIF